MKKIIALLLVANQSWAAIAFVQCQAAYPNKAVSITTSAGNALIVVTSYTVGTNRNDTITDGSSTYVHPVNIHTTVNGTPTGMDMSYALNVSAGAKTVQTVAGSGDDIGITVCEFSGVSSFDVSSMTISGVGATTTPTLETMPTSADGLVVVSYANATDGSEVTAGTGYTIDANRNSNHYDGTQYKVDVTAGNQTPFFTVTSNNHWILGAMAFSAGGGGGGGGSTGSITTIPGSGSINTIPGTGSITTLR
jgi:hypothetical protein